MSANDTTSPQTAVEANTIRAFEYAPHPIYKSVKKLNQIRANMVPISLRELRSNALDAVLNADKAKRAEVPNYENTFLPVLLLKVTFKSKPQPGSFRYRSVTNTEGNKRVLKDARAYRKYEFNILFRFCSNSSCFLIVFFLSFLNDTGRMFTFASILDNGDVAALLKGTVYAEILIWQNNPEKFGVSVGNKFAIFEPRLVGIMQESGVHYVESKSPLVELMAPSIPQCPDMSFPDTQERYFVLKHKMIRIINLQVVETFCTGTLCDRVDPQEGDGLCGCYTMDARRDGTSSSMSFYFDMYIDTTTQGHRIMGVTSLRTTRLCFLAKSIPSTSQQVYNLQVTKTLIRTKVNRLVDFVNSHGGWTIIGWGKRGTRTSSAQHENEQTLSTEVKLHASYVYPSSNKTLDTLEEKNENNHYVHDGLFINGKTIQNIEMNNMDETTPSQDSSFGNQDDAI